MFAKLWFTIGCPRIIRTCSFSRFSPLRWICWCCGFKNFKNYSSGVKAKRQTLPKSAYYSVQSLDQVSVGNRFSIFVQRPNRQQGIGKKRNPGFHNRPIGMIFVGELKSKVWNQLDVSRAQIFQHFFFFFVCKRACAAFRLILINIASWRLTTHISIKFWHKNNMKIVLAIPFWLLVSLHIFW